MSINESFEDWITNYALRPYSSVQRDILLLSLMSSKLEA